MAAAAFFIEAGHIMMFARSIGDANPLYDPTRTDRGSVVAPPTFVQASAQFDSDSHLRPAIGADGWFGSGRQPTGADRGSDGDGDGTLHAEMHFEYHQGPVKPGMVLTTTIRQGETWEKDGRSGKLRFSEQIVEYRDQDGALLVTARTVSVRTSRATES
jgi:N-terminal half of MaoC dehydratase